jgi:ribosomal protein S18 acetylase RimI-like enzyme
MGWINDMSVVQGRENGIVLRRYHIQDKQQVWELHNLALSAAGAHMGNGPWDADLKDIERTYLKPGGEFLVAVSMGRIIGMGALLRLDETTAEIKRMRVDPQHQGMGLGRRMLLSLEGTAARLGYKRIVLDTTTKQVAAQRLYENHGYTKIGRVDRGRFEVIFYEKLICPPSVPQ